MADLIPVRTALVSVSDRTGLVDLCRGLVEAGVHLIATDSTGRYLAEHGIGSAAVAEITGFPEMLGGRVKTLHPRIHGGILADRDDPEHIEQLEQAGINPIDLVVVNLYPFREAATGGLAWQQVVEQIDIGGPAMVRAAAKNHAAVAVAVSPEHYPAILEEMRAQGGLTAATRRRLAREAFAHTSAYDAAIAAWMARDDPLPPRRIVGLERIRDLRYGENPHQRAALYAEEGEEGRSVARARLLQGKEPSYNNLLDADAAWACAADFEEPACAIIKHATPCGVAVGPGPEAAYERALDCDRVSAFGGAVAFNRPLGADAARLLTGIFTEVVVAPAIEPGAREILAGKPNLRVLEIPAWSPPAQSARAIDGGLLVQDRDAVRLDRAAVRVVTKAHPTEEQWRDLLFAWIACTHVRSNAIVLARGAATVGIGGGQVSRVDAAELAVRKAGDRGRGAVCASDAFFPFRDGIDALAAGGVTAVIQPGGSVRDEEVITAADEHGLAMVLTGVRHFRHG